MSDFLFGIIVFTVIGCCLVFSNYADNVLNKMNSQILKGIKNIFGGDILKDTSDSKQATFYFEDRQFIYSYISVVGIDTDKSYVGRPKIRHYLMSPTKFASIKSVFTLFFTTDKVHAFICNSTVKEIEDILLPNSFNSLKAYSDSKTDALRFLSDQDILNIFSHYVPTKIILSDLVSPACPLYIKNGVVILELQSLGRLSLRPNLGDLSTNPKLLENHLLPMSNLINRINYLQ